MRDAATPFYVAASANQSLVIGSGRRRRADRGAAQAANDGAGSRVTGRGTDGRATRRANGATRQSARAGCFTASGDSESQGGADCNKCET